MAVAFPERERARLRLAGAIMGPNRGMVSVVSVFRLQERLDDASVAVLREHLHRLLAEGAGGGGRR